VLFRGSLHCLYILIEELDASHDAGVEQLWIDEAQRRYDAFRKGELEALSGDAVMARARSRLKIFKVKPRQG